MLNLFKFTSLRPQGPDKMEAVGRTWTAGLEFGTCGPNDDLQWNFNLSLV